MLRDGHAKGIGDAAHAGEARRAVLARFLALHLLLGHSEHLCELTLGPAAGNACLDEHRRQLLPRGSVERREHPAAQLIEVGEFGAPVVSLGGYGVQFESFELGSLARAAPMLAAATAGSAIEVCLGCPELQFVVITMRLLRQVDDDGAFAAGVAVALQELGERQAPLVSTTFGSSSPRRIAPSARLGGWTRPTGLGRVS